MINAYEADAIETAPDLSKLLSVGYPTDGNPNTGTPATLPGAAWFYMITAELMSVLTAAEVQPDRNKVNQLLEAINKLIEAAANGVKLPTGTILPCARKTVPDGFFWCNGSSFDEEENPDLYSFLGTNILPDLRDRTIWGANTADDVGKYLEDGLPNVLGSLRTLSHEEHIENVNGCFSAFGVTGSACIGGNGSYPDFSGAISLNGTSAMLYAGPGPQYINNTELTVNASLSNSIYGSSVKVQPKSTQLLIIIKV